MKKSRSPRDGFRFVAAFMGCAARRCHHVNPGLGCVAHLSPGRGALAATAAASGLTSSKRAVIKASARASHCAEHGFQSAHRSKRQSPQGDFLRRLRSFRDPQRTWVYRSRSGLMQLHFALLRHPTLAAGHRVALDVRPIAWNDRTGGRFSVQVEKKL
jgi:hypothetical protein